MAELFTPDPLTVVAGSMGGDGESGTFDDKLASVAGPFERGRSGFSDSVGYEWDLYAGPCDLGLHQILRWVADSDSAHIIMLQPPAPVLYHPYDGGVDVIAANVQSRDRLIAEFPDWLPPLGSPDGPTPSVF